MKYWVRRYLSKVLFKSSRKQCPWPWYLGTIKPLPWPLLWNSCLWP